MKPFKVAQCEVRTDEWNEPNTVFFVSDSMGVYFAQANHAKNAALIAAAPELLEALKALLDLHKPHHNQPAHAAARQAKAAQTAKPRPTHPTPANEKE
jgi:hypothetical protein